MNLGTFTGSYADGCDGPGRDGPIARDYIAPAEKGDQSGRASGGFPLGWIHELRTRN